MVFQGQSLLFDSFSSAGVSDVMQSALWNVLVDLALSLITRGDATGPRGLGPIRHFNFVKLNCKVISALRKPAFYRARSSWHCWQMQLNYLQEKSAACVQENPQFHSVLNNHGAIVTLRCRLCSVTFSKYDFHALYWCVSFDARPGGSSFKRWKSLFKSQFIICSLHLRFYHVIYLLWSSVVCLLLLLLL